MVIFIPFKPIGGRKLDKATPDSFQILSNLSLINVLFIVRCMFFSTDIVVHCHVVKEKDELENTGTVSNARFIGIFPRSFH